MPKREVSKSSSSSLEDELLHKDTFLTKIGDEISESEEEQHVTYDYE